MATPFANPELAVAGIVLREDTGRARGGALAADVDVGPVGVGLRGWVADDRPAPIMLVSLCVAFSGSPCPDATWATWRGVTWLALETPALTGDVEIAGTPVPLRFRAAIGPGVGARVPVSRASDALRWTYGHAVPEPLLGASASATFGGTWALRLELGGLLWHEDKLRTAPTASLGIAWAPGRWE